MADPCGGSEAIEAITDRIEREAAAYIERIDGMGGALGAIENGFIQGEIQNAAYAYQQEVERGERIIVGVNRFRAGEEAPPKTFRVNEAVEKEQGERLRELRAGRSAGEVEEKLGALEGAARGGENLMPHILECAAAWATVGEISDRLRRVFGEYREG